MSVDNLKNTTKLVDNYNECDAGDTGDAGDLKKINNTFATNNFYIGVSTFKNAGFGAFAKKHIKANKKLGEYFGNKITEDDAAELKCQEYIFEVYDKKNGNFFLNADNLKSSNWTRFINSCKNYRQRKLINAQFYQKDHKIWIKSLRDIDMGEEIIADYGDYYW